MTTANKITVFRFLLIPVFVTFVLYYSQSIADGSQKIGYRIAALVTFALASLSDALDGYIARKFNQSTPLGRFLDPLADKLLLLSGVLSLSLTSWHAGLPIWFGVLVIARDLIITIGWIIINSLVGHVKMNPILTSKICTVLQLSCVCWVLLDFWSSTRHIGLTILIYSAAVFTIVSGIHYIQEGIHQLREAGHTTPND